MPTMRALAGLSFALLVALGGVASAYDDKSLQPPPRGGYGGSAGAYDDKSLRPPPPPPGGGYGGGTVEYAPPPRPEGVQIFVGTPDEHHGYRPYYGPYMYPRGGGRGGGPYVGPGYGYANDADCRRWAWEPERGGKWLWGIIEFSSGQWRCAEW